MSKTRKFLSASFVVMLFSLLGFLFIQPVSMKAYASDTVLHLDMDALTLDTSFTKTANITGKISGDISSTYYVYGIADNEDIVTVQDGYTMTDAAYSLKLTAKKAGKTSVKVCIKDKTANKLVAEGYVNVTVSSYDISKLKVAFDKSSLSGYSGNAATLSINVNNLPSNLSCTWDVQYKQKTSIIGVYWDDIKYDGTNRTRKATITFLKPGTETMTFTLLEKNTKTKLASCSIDITTKENIYSNYSSAFSVDLADTDTFVLKTPSRFLSSGYMTYTHSPELEYIDSFNGEVTFKASAVGKYTVTVTHKIEYNEKLISAEAYNIDVIVTDSRKATTTTPTVTTTAKAVTTTTTAKQTTTVTTVTTVTTTKTVTTTATPIKVSMYGDANCDNIIDISDIVLLKSWILNSNKYSVSQQGLANSDVQGNGNGVNSNDIIAIQKFSLKLIDKLPV